MGIPYAAYCFLKETRLIDDLRETPSIMEKYVISCLMMGRAKMTLTPPQLKAAKMKYGDKLDSIIGWAEVFLKNQGITKVESLDYSDFEGASLNWNLNKVISIDTESDIQEKLNTYDLVLDYGTSEHVFNPAVSFLNSIDLIKPNGYLNLMLPACGWIDHGFFQFSPALYYAMESEKLKLKYLYFWIYDRSSTKIIYWDGLTQEFREHVDGAFDGSFLANCLEFIDKPINSWAVFQKTGETTPDQFLFDTQQLVYKEQWDGKRCPPPNKKKLAAFNARIMRKWQLKTILMKHKRIL